MPTSEPPYFFDGACEQCLPGRASVPDTFEDCYDCVGPTASPLGDVCAECDLHSVPLEDHSLCGSCASGKKPDENREHWASRCVLAVCIAFFLSFSESAVVPAGTSCMCMFSCPAGKRCPCVSPPCTPCATGADCVQCPRGRAGDGSSCDSCADQQGYVASLDQKACITCMPGFQPSPYNDICDACDSGRYSPLGRR